MVEMLGGIEFNIEEGTNAGLCIPLIPRDTRKRAYLTGEYVSARRPNEGESYTEKAASLVRTIFCVTTVNVDEELDLAPSLSIKQASIITRNFVRALPDDLTDADLGTGL